MILDNDGVPIDLDTPIGTVTFRDSNGEHRFRVSVTGEFWRVVDVDVTAGWAGTPGLDLTPKAARELARLILKAADVAEAERRELGWAADALPTVEEHRP